MEASRFGFDLPPAYKFDPTDEDIVARYLLPRAVCFPSAYPRAAVIDADPCGRPPWELMRRHGHADSEHAFFFGPPRAADPRMRAARAVAAGEDGVPGKWKANSSEERAVVIRRGGGGGAEMEIAYKRIQLAYYRLDGEPNPSGWVMHDYQIIRPPHLSGTVLSRVKIADRAKRKRQEQPGVAAQAQQLVPGPAEQPGPTRNLFDGEGTSSGVYSVLPRAKEDGGSLGETPR